MNTTKNDEEWTTSKYSNQNTNDVQSATFSHPEKIAITDRNTGDVISEIRLHTTDTVTLHNIGDKTALPLPFPNIEKNGIVEHNNNNIERNDYPITLEQR